jgi:Kef-type K+ transport system membrane component KefB/nucleotide-binding universal stress UspA family protein
MVNEATFGIAILLAAGLLIAKTAQLVRLPSVTGFILAGLLLGPSGVGMITAEMVGHKLDHFTQIALMLIAFGIGEHVELRRLGAVARDVGYIAVVQAVAAFVLVGAGTGITAWMIGGVAETAGDAVTLGLLLGAVAVATAPAAVLHVVRELDARGPLTSTLMAVVAVDDGLAIMIFGMAMSAAHQVAGTGASAWHALLLCFYEIGASIAIGIITGFLMDFVLHKLHNRGEMLTGGLALLLLCGEATRLLGLSPLLAGMMAGFTIINRAERDVRLFRALNAFEPPVYVLFFTLAGVHLDLSALKVAGWVGMVYFTARVVGKYGGSWLGGLMSGATPLVRNYLGLALLPQAGVAIGLVFLISSDPRLSSWSTVITPVVLAGVVLSELFGPLFARLTIEKSGEAGTPATRPECGGRSSLVCDLWLRSAEGISLSPWTDDPLHPVSEPKGVVVFGAYHFATARALARIAVILANHYHALPLSVRVFDKTRAPLADDELESLFLAETDEAGQMGFPMRTEMIYDDPASGLVASAEYNGARAVVLGYPVGRKPFSFQRVLDQVAANVLCPVVAVRFVGTLAWDRILVPFVFSRELDELYPILQAMAEAGHPQVTFLQLLHSDSSREEIASADQELSRWAATEFYDIQTKTMAEAVDSRLEAIFDRARYHDLIIMTAARRPGLKRMFFGSLANSVVRNCRKPVFVVYTPKLAKRELEMLDEL